jgi:hypothetical protein
LSKASALARALGGRKPRLARSRSRRMTHNAEMTTGEGHDDT